jgi:hypothetical protein
MYERDEQLSDLLLQAIYFVKATFRRSNEEDESGRLSKSFLLRG